MPFKKVDIKKKIEDKIKSDSEFAEAYKRVRLEYDSIQKAIQIKNK